MAINLLSGKMLESTLDRDGIDLNVAGDVIYMDVTNGRLGVNNATPAVTLDVTGNGIIADLTFTNATIDTSAGDLVLNSDSGDIVANSALTLDSTGAITAQADLTLNTTSDGVLTVVTGAGVIDIQSSSAMQMPSGTTAERPTPAAGMLRWSETLTELEFYDGTTWTVVGSGFAVVPTSQEITTANGVTTDFTLNKSTTTDAILVVINGLIQEPVNAYGVTGTTLSFVQAPSGGDNISIRFLT